MDVEKIDSQTAVIHLPVTVDSEDAPRLKQLLQTLYGEGVKFINMDFSVTELMRSPCHGLLVMYQKKLKERGGELKLVNVKNNHVKHVFDLMDLRRVISIEEIDG